MGYNPHTPGDSASAFAGRAQAVKSPNVQPGVPAGYDPASGTHGGAPQTYVDNAQGAMPSSTPAPQAEPSPFNLGG